MAKILVICPESDLSTGFLRALRDDGHKVSVATTRVDISLFSLDLFDLILVNFVLERESTVELVRDIRRRHRERRIVVLHLILRPDIVVEFMSAGAEDVVQKPLEPEGIVDVVRRFLEDEKRRYE